VPADPARLAQDCYEGYNIQVAGLAQRLAATGTKRAVISGGSSRKGIVRQGEVPCRRALSSKLPA
jgi:hypothetical protein